jgi:solute:Na+ symporter, SSS family
LLGMFAAGVSIVRLLPDDVGLGDAAALAGLTGRMEIVDLSPRPDNRYSLWSGLAGGFFLALAYFGTDQSQVQRYLGGASTAAGRLGLLFNGLFKIPMQFLILFIGILLFAFYVFARPPVHFDPVALDRARSSPAAESLAQVEARYHEAHAERAEAGSAFVAARESGGDERASAARFVAADSAMRSARVEAKRVVAEAVPGAGAEDADFIFIAFVLAMLPAGLVGLLVAVIMSAAMSSIASELNALGTTSTIDLVARFRKTMTTDTEKVRIAKFLTIVWGLVALGFASVASLFDNLIEAVNVLGSLFYGTLLGLFVVAFFLKRIGSSAVFWAGLASQTIVLACFFSFDLAFLWFNVIGCALVVVLASVLAQLLPAAPVRAS